MFSTASGSVELVKKIDEGGYGEVYETGNPAVVAKIVQFTDEEMEFHNGTLACLLSDEVVRPHLPFFATDRECAEAGIESQLWERLSKDGAATKYAVLRMEKLEPLAEKEPGVDFKDNAAEAAFVERVVTVLEHMAGTLRCFFTDFKYGNVMQRGSVDKFVLIDLDGITRFKAEYIGSPRSWYTIVCSYHALNKVYSTYTPPVTKAAFNNACWYFQRIACLCTLVDWLRSRESLMLSLNAYPNQNLKYRTKHSYCVDRIRDNFGDLASIEAASKLLLEVSVQEPFCNEHEHPEYGDFYMCRAAFVDRSFC